jgi:hypothetical protein
MDLNAQKEQFSIAYIRAVAAVAAVKVARVEVDDDSVDVLLERTGGCAPKLDLQLKCTADLPSANAAQSLPLKLKNYEDLRRPTTAPRWLVVLYVPTLPDDWMNIRHEQTLLKHHARWLSLAGFPVMDNDTSVSVHLPHENIFTPAALLAKLDEVEGGFLPL